MSDRPCAHLEAITTVRPAKRRECAECVKIRAQRVHLRWSRRRSRGSGGSIVIRTTASRTTEMDHRR